MKKKVLQNIFYISIIKVVHWGGEIGASLKVMSHEKKLIS